MARAGKGGKTGCHKTTIAEKKLRGNFSPNAKSQQKQIAIENKVKEITDIDEDTKIIPPETITDPYVIDSYIKTFEYLKRLGVIVFADIPMLDLCFLTLQKLRDVEKEIKKEDIKKDIDKYEKLLSIQTRLETKFDNYAKNFYLSPLSRTKLKIDALDIEKKKNDIAIQNKDIVSQLMEEKIS